MIPSAPTARRSPGLSSILGLSGNIFASGAERELATTVERGLAVVEQELMAQLAFTDDLVDAVARYLLQAGGKRVRPALTLITAQLGEGNTDDVITAAQVIEITHLASLYHDDVMDEAELRRGVPSAQSVWGNSVAILTGDLLFSRAAKLISQLGQRGIELQADTFERLCLGQLHETIGPREGEDPVAHYLGVLADKTGSLIAAAAQVGVIYSHAAEEYLRPVVDFGERIGVAFQLVDDVIDLSPRPGTGKAAGTDLRSGVSTLPLLLLRAEAATDAAAADLLERIELAAADPAGGRLDRAVEALRKHEVTKQTLAYARQWGRDAIAALEPLPQGPVRKALTRFAEALVRRSS